MGIKSEFKPVCKKIWKAFNSWRKRGMWFRVTVLLVIGFAINFERLYTTNHVPLINEFVLIACKAIRMGSEPRVTYSHLRYLHVQKTRQLQNQLRAKVKNGSLCLNANEIKLLNENTLNANYNKLFALAKRAGIIHENISLSQTKRAMLDKSLKLTAERFDPEWADVRKKVLTVPPLSLKQLQLNFLRLWRTAFVVFPFPIIPVLPWFILCLTLGFWGARSKYKAKWIVTTIIAFVMTVVWIYVANHGRSGWFWGWSSGEMIGRNVFFASWAIIGSIMGKRFYSWTLEKKYDTIAFIILLSLAGTVLLMPIKIFRVYYMYNRYFWCWTFPGNYLQFKSSAFVPYFVAVGIAVLCYIWFLIYKNYAEFLKKSLWLLLIQCLLTIFIIGKLIYWLNLVV